MDALVVTTELKMQMAGEECIEVAYSQCESLLHVSILSLADLSSHISFTIRMGCFKRGNVNILSLHAEADSLSSAVLHNSGLIRGRFHPQT